MKRIQTLLENRVFYFSLIISIAFYFILYQINVEDLWYDEIASFWVADPNMSFQETNDRWLKSENTPILYYIIIKFFFNLFGYDPNLLRIVNIPLFIISLIYFNSILSKVSKNIFFIFFASLLFIFNSFLIAYAQEGRVFMLFCMLSLMLINQYMLLNQPFKNITYAKFQYFILFLLTFTLLNTFIFSLLILGSIIFYEIFFKINKINYIILVLIFLPIVLFILINYQFLLNLMKFDSPIQHLDINFYYNFYFKQFFGSKIMGLFFLIFFLWSIFYFIKLKIKNENITLIFLIIFFSYFVPIIYGFFFTPVLQDKYIIYVVPLIILIISYFITHYFNVRKNNMLVGFIILLSLSNQLFKNYKSDINKPMFKSAIEKVIKINKSKLIYASYSDNKNELVNSQLQNYFKHLSLVRINNLSIIKKPLNNNFFLICYDSSNTYNFCSKNKELKFSGYQLSHETRFYQVILFHYNKK
jgi:hypothetical protein